MSEGGATAVPTAGELSRAAIARVDPSGQLGDVLALPEHLRDALWRVESAIMEDSDASSGLVVAGMGGSAIGGALARAALGDQLTRPIFVTRAYGLPTWTTPDTMVLCASYSGNTEETLACFESAGALGARRIAVTTGGRLAEMAREEGVPVIPIPGGFQPRAAVAYMIVGGARGGGADGSRPAAHLRDRRGRLPHRAPGGGVGPGRARGLARQGTRARAARHDPGHRGCRPDQPRSPTAGRPRSTRTPSSPASGTNCPSSTTTRSRAGRAPARWDASRPCSWTTPTPIRA